MQRTNPLPESAAEPLPTNVTPDLENHLAAVLGEVRREVDVPRAGRFFCNRNLRMDGIELIGFDMDYTLALYQQDRLEKLSIDLTLGKLIQNHGYPDAIKTLTYDSAYAIRGLVVDRQLGNVFKMDRHGHVGRVFHGYRLLSRDDRARFYRHERIRLSQPRYAWIDTLFGLPEAVMYMSLVDHFDQQAERPAYDKLFDDIRASIDEAHRDDTLKTVIKADLNGFIHTDPRLAESLHKLRSSGKKLFLLTNSLWDYTSAVMRNMLDGKRPAYPSWRNYFDVVIVGGSKPAFFTERRPFVEIDPGSGKALAAPVGQLTRGRIYQGGNIADFERMTGVRGEKVLYVGDHIYGDILRLKKSHIWRTAMVIQELEQEIGTSERLAEQISSLDLLDRKRRNLEAELDLQVLLLKSLQRLSDECVGVGMADLKPKVDENKRQAKQALDQLRAEVRHVAAEVLALEQMIDQAYNPHWGALFHEGTENSRFGEQVYDYADLYTSRVSNFLSYSPLRYFRAPRKQMPHEL